MNHDRINALIGAAAKIDRNSGYQPCFHLNENGSFCGNSHGEEHLGHRHVSFETLLREVAGLVVHDLQKEHWIETEYRQLRDRDWHQKGCA